MLTKGNYFWRVRSRVSEKGDSDASNYSDFGNFKIDDVTGIAEQETKIPTVFSLIQNYPNPFNPSAVISYSLPNAQFVTLRVYNMLGQEITTLVNEELNAGIYSVSWNGIDNSGVKVSSGTYIYRIIAGNSILSKKNGSY